MDVLQFYSRTSLQTEISAYYIISQDRLTKPVSTLLTLNHYYQTKSNNKSKQLSRSTKNREKGKSQGYRHKRMPHLKPRSKLMARKQQHHIMEPCYDRSSSSRFLQIVDSVHKEVNERKRYGFVLKSTQCSSLQK